jgi:hypothetical protein
MDHPGDADAAAQAPHPSRSACTRHERAIDAAPVQQRVLCLHVVDQVGLAQHCILLGLLQREAICRGGGWVGALEGW